MRLEFNTAGVLTKRYVAGPGVDEPLVWYEGTTTTDRRWLHADERGSVVAISDGAGAMLGINRYDEYGIPQSSNLGRFGYTGQTWIGELGLWHYKARAYSPTLGRFMQTDPIGYGDGLNWYNYVGGDPVNSRDPNGKSDEFTTKPEILSWPRQSLQDDFTSALAWRSDTIDQWTSHDRSSFTVDAPPGSPCLGFGGPCDPRNENDGPDQQRPLPWVWQRIQEGARGSALGRFLTGQCTGQVNGRQVARAAAGGAVRGVVTGSARGAVMGSFVGPEGTLAGAAGGAPGGATTGAATSAAVSVIRQACEI